MADKHIKYIKSAMYDTPIDYKTSEKYYSRMLKDKIDDTYEFSSDTFEIEVEKEHGTMVFEPIICRVCHAIEPKTGLQRGDDFKDLKFFDLKYDKGIGTRYRFDNSIWITCNTDNTKYITKSNVVRRCNNVLKYINDDGEIVEEPCIIEYAMKYSNIYYNDLLDIPQGTISIIAQNNINSSRILINDRFIFDTQVYKIKSKQDFLRENTFDKNSAALIKFEANIDPSAPDDNFELGIASMNKYKYIYNPTDEEESRIELSPNIDYVLEGQTTVFECYLYNGNDKLDNVFDIYCDTVRSSFYDFDIIDGNHFSIKNNKMNLSHIVKIRCETDGMSKTFDIQLRGLF